MAIVLYCMSKLVVGFWLLVVCRLSINIQQSSNERWIEQQTTINPPVGGQAKNNEYAEKLFKNRLAEPLKV